MKPFSKGSCPGKSRKGAVPVNIETLMNQVYHNKTKSSALQFRAFSLALQEKFAAGDYNPLYRAPRAGTMSAAGIRLAPSVGDDEEPKKKQSEDVSRTEALEAAKQLTKKRQVKKHLAVAGLSGTAAPAIAAASRAAKGFLDTPGTLRKRLGGAATEVGQATLGEVGSQAVGGGLTGAVLSAGREGLQLHGAKKKVRSFLGAPARSLRERRAKRRVESLLQKED
jgi:hypothetical protein